MADASKKYSAWREVALARARRREIDELRKWRLAEADVVERHEIAAFQHISALFHVARRRLLHGCIRSSRPWCDSRREKARHRGASKAARFSCHAKHATLTSIVFAYSRRQHDQYLASITSSGTTVASCRCRGRHAHAGSSCRGIKPGEVISARQSVSRRHRRGSASPNLILHRDFLAEARNSAYGVELCS